jgi:hypothetical protein
MEDTFKDTVVMDTVVKGITVKGFVVNIITIIKDIIIVVGTMVDYREVVNPLGFKTIMEVTTRVEVINMVVVLEYSYYL